MEGQALFEGQDGTITIVDKDGNPVKYPPAWSSQYVKSSGADKNYYIKGEEEREYKLLEVYKPPSEDVYIYTAADGSTTLVDETGKPIKSPPHLKFDQVTKENVIIGKDGSFIKAPDFNHPIVDIYNGNILVHVNQDGSISVVDANGKSIDSPPIIKKYTDDFGKVTYLAKDANGTVRTMTIYKPPSSHWDKKKH